MTAQLKSFPNYISKGHSDNPVYGEKIAVALFFLLYSLVPLLFTELYPFSRATMFSDAPRSYSTFEIRSPEGNSLSPDLFGLRLVYTGDSPIKRGNQRDFGVHSSRCTSCFDPLFSGELVVAHFEQRLAQIPDLPYVDVVQTVYGTTPTLDFGVVDILSITIVNPTHGAK